MAKALNFLTAGLCGLAVVASAPAHAEVLARTDAGFVVRVTAEVSASPADAWKAFTTPSLWWNPQHTFSGEAANLTMDPSANGCFCEKLPVPKGAPATQKPGSVMHMRVVYAEPYRALRLVGGLGPLQSEAVNGTMTVTFKPVDGSDGKTTRILWEYVVGGFMRYKTETISGAVDKVLAEQIAGLAKLVGPVAKPVQSPGDFRLPLAPEKSSAPAGAPIGLAPSASDKAATARVIDDGRAPVGDGPRSTVTAGTVESARSAAVDQPSKPAEGEGGAMSVPDQPATDSPDRTVPGDTTIVEVPLEPSAVDGEDAAIAPQAPGGGTGEKAEETPPPLDKVNPDTEVTLRKLFGKKKRSDSSQ
ncbi:SRPBCC family protein [Novosphingobium taihuense]|uniref:Uncharacterized protein YndB with AHSA1/START domain n=1 Tax=Novosphingobium taihuense TaxID=260085 RepID=A0A7W7EUC8_9SPHN|nr:SRPBCC family protein [Novosphingobium taihuense]MBB4612200.1 uncharacterized protein YndB with AHSA1/START domain [Novosphingobium taihuense]TWH88446.1 uncharacterized protein YndB with AHSA1/START domain [Novosphingobium taihuense]